MSVASDSERGNRLPIRAFSSGSSGPKKPFSFISLIVSWFTESVSTDTSTGVATQEPKISLPRFHEFVKHLCGVSGQNKDK
jgi:hypothetical protein